MPMFLKHGETPASGLPSLPLPGELAPREATEQLFVPDQVGGDEGISELCVRRTAAASLAFFPPVSPQIYPGSCQPLL